jgi:hypothetical protein
VNLLTRAILQARRLIPSFSCLSLAKGDESFLLLSYEKLHRVAYFPCMNLPIADAVELVFFLNVGCAFKIFLPAQFS